MPRKIRLKNLRVDGMRVDLPTFRAVADQLLPGPDATPNEQRKGKKTKLTIARELCAVDPDFRKRFKAAARDILAGPARARAAEMGYDPATAPVKPAEPITPEQQAGCNEWAGKVLAWIDDPRWDGRQNELPPFPERPAWLTDEIWLQAK